MFQRFLKATRYRKRWVGTAQQTDHVARNCLGVSERYEHAATTRPE